MVIIPASPLRLPFEGSPEHVLELSSPADMSVEKKCTNAEHSTFYKNHLEGNHERVNIGKLVPLKTYSL